MKSTGICRWLFLLISLSTWTTFTSSKEMRVVCYYTNWSVYRPGAAKFNPQNINPYLCTHLIYAFGGFTKENTLKPFDKYQDIEKGGYAKFTGLKTYNKNLKTMLAIGGWNEGSSRFSPMVANAERRRELVKNTIKFLRQNHFDGLDLDWEYPTFRDGGKSRDRDNYAQLVQELREEFDRESEKTGRPRLLLTMAVPAGIEYINKGYDVPKLMQYLDWMNILSYDYHSAFEPAVNHHAPLFSLEEDNEYNYDAELNIDYTIKHYLKLGADPHKLVLGIPTYGRSYTLYNPEANEIGSPADGPGDMGEATRENGYLAYYEICENIKSQGWEVEQPNPNAMGPYAFKDNQWVGYDDENIVRKKSEYVAENGLGGIMFWAIDNDDFRGNCHGKPYPLIEAGKEALLDAYGLTDDNLVSPPAKSKSRPRSRTKLSNKVKNDEEENTKGEKVSNSGGLRRRNRIKSKSKDDRESGSSRLKNRRKEAKTTTTTEAATTHSSLRVVTPSYTTPAPPSTPELDGAFKCEDEGFFPHPKDCKKYFWCLSGAADSGIVAHQFTCPAGLYFNKAADSCDYSQNVLCNKKLQKPTTTTKAPTGSTTSPTTTTPAPISLSTSRAPPKITAATSRTTFLSSTTTEAYDEEYEYEDDDAEDDDEDEKIRSDAEEDPKVIKELIELIKKAGGLEELEKQLNGPRADSASSSKDSTTPSTISKSLYERVLNKAVNSLNSKKNSLTALRNSRGPQNDGLAKTEETSLKSKTERGKLQYTSISRRRPSTEKTVEEEEEEVKETKDDDTKTRRTFSKKFQPEYVTIRRPKVSSTTEATESESSLSRNRILGEASDEEYEDDIEDEDDDEDVVEEDEPSRKQHTPQYVNIRRQRPTTTEETTTSKYTVIRRGSTSTTESALDANEDNTTTTKYKTIRRGSTPSSSTTTEQENSSKFQLRRGTTQQTSTTPSAVSDGATSRFKNFRRGSTTPKPSDSAETTISNESSTTTPLEDDNDVTPRSTTFKQRGSTEAPQVLTSGTTTNHPQVQTIETTTVTIGNSITDLPNTSTKEPNSKTSKSGDDNITTIANAIDDIATTEVSSMTGSGANTSNLQTSNTTTNTTSTNIGDNETGTSEKNHPHLLEPRPFSIFSRSSSTTVKPITESPIQSSKVSQSNFKFRVKPKNDLHDTKTVQASTSTERPVSKSNVRLRSRGGTRFSSNHQNPNDFSGNEHSKDDDVNSRLKTRNRLSTTEKYIEEYRTYRPSELADLSSLTAVDFERIKELNFYRGTQRRRRPITLVTTETLPNDSDEEIADESLKTSSRTLPIARKLAENLPTALTRRKKNDYLDAEVSATTKRVRGFGSRTTRQPSTTETPDTVSKNEDSITSQTVSVTPRTRRIIRRFRSTTVKPTSDKGNKQNDNQSIRSRTFAVRKDNKTASDEHIKPSEETLTEHKQTSLQRLFNKKPTRLPFAVQKNNIEEESDDSVDEDSSTEEGENIKLSESNIRENSDINSYDLGGKPNRRLFKVPRPKSEIHHDKLIPEIIKTVISEPSIAEEHNFTESIKLTTETTTAKIIETSSSKTGNNQNVTLEITESDYTSTTEKVKTSTQQPISIRTRKIIRKLRPTTPTITTERTPTTQVSTGRKRKIIRRLKPLQVLKQDLETSTPNINNTTNTDETKNQTEQGTAKQLFRPSLTRPRGRYIKANVEVENSTEANKDAANAPAKISLRRLPNQNKNDTKDSNKEDNTKRIFRPKLSANKYKSLENARLPFRSFSRTNTTAKHDLIIETTTESLKVNTSTKEDIEETQTEKTDNKFNIDNSTIKSEEPTSNTDNNGKDSIPKLVSVTNSSDIDANNNSDISVTTLKPYDTITERTFTQKVDLTTSPTVQEDLPNTTVDTTENSDTAQFTSSTEFADTEFPGTEAVTRITSNLEETESSTSNIIDLLPPSSEEDTRQDDDDDEDEDEDVSEKPKRNRKYVSVFRKSTTSNTFKDFDSETEDDSPKFEDLFEDKDKKLFDDIKFDDHQDFTPYRYNIDDDDEFPKYDDDQLVGDTSTEFRSEFSYTPNDIFDEDKTEGHSTESSSQRNRFFRPHRPSFIRPKFTISTTERQTSPRPKYKTFSRTSTKTLRKETIQIQSFNDTDADGNPVRAVNKVLLTNRFKFKTSESTTFSPEISNSSESTENNSTAEESIVTKGTTISDIANAEAITSESSETTPIISSTTDRRNVGESTFNSETTIIPTNPGTYITTEANEKDSDDITTTIEPNEYTTLVSEPTVTEDLLFKTETTFNAYDSNPTESVNSAEFATSTENYLETTDASFSTSEQEISTESVTTDLPETTTPYHRKSTLRPINSRPKFTPIRRKNAFSNLPSDQTDVDSKPKTKYVRNHYQKPTTESTILSHTSVSSNNLEKSPSSTPTSYLKKYSRTRKPITFNKDDTKQNEEHYEIHTGDPIQRYASSNSGINFKINPGLYSTRTTAVPINQFLLSRSTTEANNADDKESDVEYNEEEYDDDDNEDIPEEIEDEENKETKEFNTASETPVNNVKPLTKPKISRISNSPVNIRRPNSPIRGNNPFIGRSTTARVVNKPVFGKPTETPKVTEDLSDIDTEAVKNRNKNLFSKQRKVNSPISAASVNPDKELESETTTTSTVTAATNELNTLETPTIPQDVPQITVSPTTESIETVSKIIVPETTEYLTTLHHVFAEVNDSVATNNVETTTEYLNSAVTSTTGKIERWIEVNRIVQVKTKEAKVKNHVVEEQPTAEVVHPVLDKIGEVNRVTVIKVVDGNDTVFKTINSRDNEIKQTDPISPVYTPEATTEKSRDISLSSMEIPAKVEEIPAPSIQGKVNVTDITVTIDEISNLLHTSRQDRKLDVSSKSGDFTNINQLIPESKAEIIDGRSHISIITPRPVFTEASTIALEGLFQTESAHTTNSPKEFSVATQDEVLETEHSKFVNVRVLHPDESYVKATRGNSQLLPIKLLKQDEEEVTLKAEVVEIKPKTSLGSIKIAPIQVEMSRRVSNNVPIFRVTPQDINTGLI